MNERTSSTSSRPARRAARPKPDRLVGNLPRRRLQSQSRRQNGAEAARVPVHIRAIQGLNPIERDYVRNRLADKLRKHVMSIERVSVRLEDVNGPRGGVDQSCRIKVVLGGLPSVVVESRDAKLSDAIDTAIHSVERAVRRATERRRMKPLRRS